MSHVAVVYEYAPDSEQLHAQNGDAHVAFLQRLMDDGVLRLSGRADIDSRRGALLVLTADAEQALPLLDEDPFWTAGVIAERRVWPWTIVFDADRLAR